MHVDDTSHISNGKYGKFVRRHIIKPVNYNKTIVIYSKLQYTKFYYTITRVNPNEDVINCSKMK